MNNFIYKIFFLIKWKKKIFPVIIQSSFSNKILMLAWINKWCFLESFFFKKTCFWSRSINCFWRKGFTSLNIQIIKNTFFDCDIDVFLFKVVYVLNNCHYNLISCFNYNL